MTHAALRFMAFVVGSLFLAGCGPDDMPAYVNDGKTVVAEANGALWTYDVATGKATPHTVRGGWQLERARMIGDQVWSQWSLDRGDDPHEYSCKLFDPVKNEFIAGPKELEGKRWLDGAIPASYDGKKCFFVPTGSEPAADGKIAYDMLTFPELKKTTSVKLNQVLSAGGFRWVTVVVAVVVNEAGKGQVELERAEVFNQEGKEVLSIPHDEARKMKCKYGRFPGYARINEEEKVLLLAFGEQGSFNFGIFDTSNGKFLWGGHTRNALAGNPLVKRNEAWSLEGDEITLVRHTPGDVARDGKRETILRCRETCRFQFDQYTPSPDGSNFVMVVSGMNYKHKRPKPARLLFIPIKEGVTEKDVKAVELTNRATPP